MEQSNADIIFELLSEFREHRDAIMIMINDLEVIKKDIDRLIPKKLDARYARFFEEKIKSVTELFKTLLEMRKEIQKSLKEEIDIRRKVNVVDDERDIEKIIDIRQLANKVETFQNDRKKMRHKTLEKAQRETDEIASEIVTVQESG
jgi:hypothetical protein